MKFSELKELLRKDRERWDNISAIKLYFFKEEYRLIRLKRFCDYFKTKRMLKPMYYWFRWRYHRYCRKCGCDIPSHVVFGGGVKLLHAWGIVINSKCEIGENVTIVSGTVVGGARTGVPRIGNNVKIGAHALILGGIFIGDDSEIGAGAIVTHDSQRVGLFSRKHRKCGE